LDSIALIVGTNHKGIEKTRTSFKIHKHAQHHPHLTLFLVPTIGVNGKFKPQNEYGALRNLYNPLENIQVLSGKAM
jgi:hypothetical protein